MAEERAVIEELKRLDRDLLNPKRLSILVILYVSGPKTMAQLVRLTGLSWGDLESNLRKLREKGIIEMSKTITPNGIRTMVKLTPYGVKTFLEMASKLELLLKILRGDR